MTTRNAGLGTTARIESLESRQFLSAALDLGVLQIIGTHKSDTILLTIEPTSPDQLTVNINGSISRFAISDIKSVNIQAGQGNDLVDIDPGKTELADITTRIYGSGGNDTLMGGAGKDRIYGGAGNDSIAGNGARDILYGESGKDTLDGGRGSDFLDGGSGNDSLVGGLGVDTLIGGSGNDTIDAVDETTDSVNGGSGTDTAYVDDIDGLINIERPFVTPVPV